MKPAEKWFVNLPGARLKPLSVGVTVDDIRAIQLDAMQGLCPRGRGQVCDSPDCSCGDDIFAYPSNWIDHPGSTP